MRKTFRRIAALAVFAAMTVAMIPNAFAAREVLMVDDVLVNRNNVYDLSKTGSPKNDALADMVKASNLNGKYNDLTNTFTLNKLPSSIPYIRPDQYDSAYAAGTFNYGPYIPLTVNLSFFDGTNFVDLTAGVIKVDGRVYTYKAPTASTAITESQIAMLLAGYSNTTYGIATPAGGVYDVAYYNAESYYGLNGFNGASNIFDIQVADNGDPSIAKHSVVTDPAKLAGMALRYFTAAKFPDGTSANIVKATMLRDLISSERYLKVAKLLNADEQEILFNLANKIASAAANAVDGNTTGRYAAMQEAASKELLKALQVTTASTSFSNVYAPINVYHYVFGDSDVHTITYVPAGSSTTYTRRFTFAIGTDLDLSWGVVSATKSLDAAAINKDNIFMYAGNGAVYIDFAQKDVLATDTWGTASSAYKLWDQSNFNLYGGWVSFKSAVKEGDTVYLQGSAVIKSSKDALIPAGTELTLTYSDREVSDKSETTFQYKNQYKVTVAADGSIPILLRLDKADMNWLYNTHNQKYVQVNFTNSTGAYAGNFFIITRAVDRLTTGNVNVDSGTRITLKVGETKTINASFANNNAMSTETIWATNNAGIASVNKTAAMQATVTGVSVGSAIVTVSGNKDSITTSIIVDVVSDTPTEVVKTYKVVTASSSLNVRSGMGTSFSIIGKLKKGTTFQGIASADGDWVKMTYVNQTGYVSAKYVIVID